MNPSQPTPSPLIISISDAASRVCISKAELYRKIKAGDFPLPVRLTEKRRGIRVSDLNAWVEGLTPVVPDKADHFKAA